VLDTEVEELLLSY